MSVETFTNLQWLSALQQFGEKPGLHRMRTMLEALHHPESDLQFLHVAGTNGKGSVCAFLSHLLERRCQVGLFTSPAFDGYRGRFCINGQDVSSSDFDRLAGHVRQVSEHILRDEQITEFEALTLIAILYFAERKVDVVVWETGLGGRLDSTNVVTPVVSVITNVGLDHMHVLGHTVRAIAAEKAGIIKPGVPVVTAAEGEALDVIRAAAQQCGSPLYEKGVHFSDIPLQSMPPTGHMAMHYRGVFQDVYNVELGLYGMHQFHNAAVALAAAEVVVNQGLVPPFQAQELRCALSQTVWPGRFETFDNHPQYIVVDGAHNEPGVQTLKTSLQRFATWKGASDTKWTLVIGVLSDKAVVPMLRKILPLAREVYITAPQSPRAMSVEHLYQDVISVCQNMSVAVADSVPVAVEAARKTGTFICCWGSLYTAHEARKAIQQSAESYDGGR